jgi:hypothetical protein
MDIRKNVWNTFNNSIHVTSIIFFMYLYLSLEFIYYLMGKNENYRKSLHVSSGCLVERAGQHGMLEARPNPCAKQHRLTILQRR